MRHVPTGHSAWDPRGRQSPYCQLLVICARSFSFVVEGWQVFLEHVKRLQVFTFEIHEAWKRGVFPLKDDKVHFGRFLSVIVGTDPFPNHPLCGIYKLGAKVKLVGEKIYS